MRNSQTCVKGKPDLFLNPFRKNWKASVLLEDADDLSLRDAVFCSYGSMLYVCRILGGLGT